MEILSENKTSEEICKSTFNESLFQCRTFFLTNVRTKNRFISSFSTLCRKNLIFNLSKPSRKYKYMYCNFLLPCIFVVQQLRNGWKFQRKMGINELFFTGPLEKNPYFLVLWKIELFEAKRALTWVWVSRGPSRSMICWRTQKPIFQGQLEFQVLRNVLCMKM